MPQTVSAQRYPAGWLQRSVHAAAHGQPSTMSVPIAIRLSGRLDPGRLRTALNGLVARHEALRTRLVMSGGELVQVVTQPGEPLAVPDQRVSVDALAGACLAEFARPFHPDEPLLRARLFAIGPGDHLLAITADHTIMDGFSAGVVLRDLAALYAGDQIPPPELQFGDYAEQESRPVSAAQRGYWENLLSAAAGRVAFATPPGAAAGQIRTDAGTLPQADHDAIAALARRSRVPVVAVLAALAVLPLRDFLGRSTVLGLFVSNRERRDLAGTVGFIADLMPLPVRIRPDTDLAGLAVDIAEQMYDCLEHRVPLRAIRDLLRPRDGTPLFDITLNYLPPLRQLTRQSADGLSLSGAFIESAGGTRVVPGWHDGAAFVDYRWRAANGRLTGALDISGPAAFDAPARAAVRGTILGETERCAAGHGIRLWPSDFR